MCRPNGVDEWTGPNGTYKGIIRRKVGKSSDIFESVKVPPFQGVKRIRVSVVVAVILLP